MCIIVDSNNVNRVFHPNNKERLEFLPVYQWIISGNGKLVIGGSKFHNELKKNQWFMPLLSQLSRVGKVLNVPALKVDQLTEEIKLTIREGEDFDDPHIVSLLALSGCKLICSADKRAYPYFTKSDFFTKSHRPKIYSSSRNKDLLKDQNICDMCKPTSKINKETLQFLSSVAAIEKLRL